MDEVELSDDEKEAEYKRSLKQNKRDANHGNQEYGFGKKKNNFKDAGFDRSKQLQALLCRVEFVKYMPDFYKYLDMGLQNFEKHLQFAISMLQGAVKHCVILDNVDEQITKEGLKQDENVDEKKKNKESKEKQAKTGILVFDLGGGLHHYLMEIVVESMLGTASIGIGYRAEGQE